MWSVDEEYIDSCLRSIVFVLEWKHEVLCCFMAVSLFSVWSANIKLQCFHKHSRTQEANLIFYTIMSIKRSSDGLLLSSAGGTRWALPPAWQKTHDSPSQPGNPWILFIFCNLCLPFLELFFSKIHDFCFGSLVFCLEFTFACPLWTILLSDDAACNELCN